MSRRPFAELDRDRGSWKRDHSGVIMSDPRIRGTVLDIGSAGGTGAPFNEVYTLAGAIDGVDPDPAVLTSPVFRHRWQSTLEDAAEIPDGAYDAAVAFVVVEHVATPRAFLEKVFRLLKPGGVFYATTVSSHHPFAWTVRVIERLGLKRAFVGRTEARVNEYPAYYRMNSPRAVAPLAREIGFSRADFYYHPCVQWDVYFPRWVRFAPNLYDRMVGIRVPGLNQTVMYRLEKPGRGISA